MSNSFTNQVIAQIELFGHTDELREARLHAAQAPRREGRAAAPRRARREADRADRRARPPTSASRSRARTSPTTTATSVAGAGGRAAEHGASVGPAARRRRPRAGPRRARRGSPGPAGRCRCWPRSASGSPPSGRWTGSGSPPACTSPPRRRTCVRDAGRRRRRRSRCARPTRCRPRTTSPRRWCSSDGVEVRARARRGPRHLRRARAARCSTAGPQITLDDGADLLVTAHATRRRAGRGADRRHRGDDHRPRAPAPARGRGRAALPGAGGQRGADRARAQRPPRHRPVGARRDHPRQQRAAGRPHAGRASATAGPGRGSPSAPAAPARR